MKPDLALAFDLGGTRLKSGVVEVGTGRVVARSDTEATRSTWEAVRHQIEETARDLRQSGIIETAGLAVPGILVNGIMSSLPGKLPGLEGFDVAQWVATLSTGDRPGVAVNDAAAAGIGEAVIGAGRDHERVVMITLGTGVGVAVVERGRLLGSGPLGGGILGGQIPLVYSTDGLPADTAGSDNTIEQGCRSSALVARAEGPGTPLTSARAVFAAAESGDERAVRAVSAHRAALAAAIAALAHAHSPSAVVVGGGLAEDQQLFRGLPDLVNPLLKFGLTTAVLPAQLGQEAALTGLSVMMGWSGAR